MLRHTKELPVNNPEIAAFFQSAFEGIVDVQPVGEYMGQVVYCAVREITSYTVWRCGYVALHKKALPEHEDCTMSLLSAPVNGGITFDKKLGDFRVLGWDYNHWCNRGDNTPSTERVLDEARELIQSLNEPAPE